MVESPTPADPEHSTAQPDTFLIDNATTLRAIAHPLRQQILDELGLREFGRAADLAVTLDQPANAISFHLRTLARAGLIVPAPEHARDRRDRVWKPVAERYEIQRKLAGSAAVVDPVIDWLREAMSKADGDSGHYQLTAGVSLLTEDEARQLGEELTEVVNRWSERSAQAARSHPDEPDRRPTQVMFALGPRRRNAAKGRP
ncbi:MAG: helix-turn-helix domain-containing protein [Propionicimonas sp.]